MRLERIRDNIHRIIDADEKLVGYVALPETFDLGTLPLLAENAKRGRIYDTDKVDHDSPTHLFLATWTDGTGSEFSFLGTPEQAIEKMREAIHAINAEFESSWRGILHATYIG